MPDQKKFFSKRALGGVRNYSAPIRSNAPLVRGDERSKTSAGVEVTDTTYLTVDTVLACVRVLAESVACLPLDLMRRDEASDTVKKATDHRLHELLRWQPNPEFTSYELRVWMMLDALLYGRGVAQVLRDKKGEIIEIWPLEAKRLKPRRRKNGQLYYTYTPAQNGNAKSKEILLEANEVLRVQVMSNGGLLGYCLLQLQKEAVGSAKASEKYSSEFFANGGAVSGVLEVPEELSEAAYNRLKKDWKESHSATGKRHGVPILEAGAKFNGMELDHEKTQLIETRKFQRSTLAGLFRVPAHMINDLEKATFSNIEHQDLSFLKHTLRPWLTNFEQRLRLTCLTAEEKKTLYFKHNDRDLLRGDFPTRMDGYSKAVSAGIFSPNDCRRFEDQNPYEGGDKYLVNSTLVDVNKLPDPNKPKQA